MTDLNDDAPILPDELDPVIDRHLLTMPRLTPGPGFENRVLARVWRPAPMFVLIWRDRMRQLATPGRVWAAVGAMAAGSTVWILAIGSWLAQSAPSLQEAREWVTFEVAVPAISAVNAAAATWWGTAVQYGSQYVSPGNRLSSIITVLLVIPVVCAIALILLMRLPMPEKTRSHAAR